MKTKTIFVITMLFLISCSSKNEINNKQEKILSEENTEKDCSRKGEGIYPIEIFYEGIGINEPRTSFREIIEINSDSVFVKRNCKVLFAFKSNETEFPKILRDFGEKDFGKNKHYYHPFVRDGGRCIINTKFSKKTFTNVEPLFEYFEKIEILSANELEDCSFKIPKEYLPDTTGLMKFKPLLNYSGKFYSELKR